MSLSSSTIIGMIMPVDNGYWDHQDFFTRLCTGAQATAAAHGSSLVVVQVNWSKRSTLLLASNQIAGWIALTATDVSLLRQTGRPMVTILEHFPGLPLIVPDNRNGMRQAMRHLLHHGHTRIAFAGTCDNLDIQQRYETYLEALAEATIPFDPGLVITPQPAQRHLALRYAGGLSAAQQLLAQGLPCTAIVCGTDALAIGLIETLRAAGYRVPEDVAVIGFDNEEVAQYADPPLTTVHQSFEALGRDAVEVLLALLRGENPAAVTMTPTDLRIRHSCGCRIPTMTTVSIDDSLNPQVDWQTALARQVISLALGNDVTAAAPFLVQVEAKIVDLVHEVDAIIQGHVVTLTATITEACAAIVTLTTDLNRLQSILLLLEHTWMERLACPQASLGPQSNLVALIACIRTELTRAHHRLEKQEIAWLNQLLGFTQSLSQTLFGQDSHRTIDLTWFAETSVMCSYLALCSDEPSDAASELIIAGTYSQRDRALPPIGSRFRLADFPPSVLLNAGEAPAPPSVTILLWLRTTLRTWGVLSIEFSPDIPGLAFRMWANLVSTALERTSLLKLINHVALPQPMLITEDVATWYGAATMTDNSLQHGMIELRFVEVGVITYVVGGVQTILPAQHIAIAWTALPTHIVAIEPGTHYYRVTVPLAWFLERQLPDVVTQPVLYGKLVIDPGVLDPATDAALFQRWHADLQTNSSENQKIVLLEIEARLHRLARAAATSVITQLVEPVQQQSSQSNQHKAEQMAQFIAQHYAEPIHMNDIADAVGLNHDYATRLFRNTFGMRPLEYISQYRLAHAQRLLLTTDASVARIALEAGFGTISHFHQVFKRVYGQPPRAFARPILRMPSRKR